MNARHIPESYVFVLLVPLTALLMSGCPFGGGGGGGEGEGEAEGEGQPRETSLCDDIVEVVDELADFQLAFTITEDDFDGDELPEALDKQGQSPFICGQPCLATVV